MQRTWRQVSIKVINVNIDSVKFIVDLIKDIQDLVVDKFIKQRINYYKRLTLQTLFEWLWPSLAFTKSSKSKKKEYYQLDLSALLETNDDADTS